jgi:hypothetical protein
MPVYIVGPCLTEWVQWPWHHKHGAAKIAESFLQNLRVVFSYTQLRNSNIPSINGPPPPSLINFLKFSQSPISHPLHPLCHLYSTNQLYYPSLQSKIPGQQTCVPTSALRAFLLWPALQPLLPSVLMLELLVWSSVPMSPLHSLVMCWSSTSTRVCTTSSRAIHPNPASH